MKNDCCVRIKDEVQAALDAREPVVALESTVITHGMPYPENVVTALEVEETVAQAGALPATIAIIDGAMRIGLSKEEIEKIGKGSEAQKATERDLSRALALNLTCGTTVSATLAIAECAGIHVFATGGIGGVARDAATSFDISSDLTALSAHQCIVVCSGAKAFMDIAATIEYLETHRVPVVSFGSTYFPLFFTQSSGVEVDWHTDSPEEIARTFRMKLKLGQPGAILVGVPIPKEHELPQGEMQDAVTEALERLGCQGISGPRITPFLLSEINKITDGRSLEANKSLIRNNAAVGARIAAALSVVQR